MSFIIDFLFRNLKIETKVVNELIKACDKDADGFISVGELVAFIKDFAKKK